MGEGERWRVAFNVKIERKREIKTRKREKTSMQKRTRSLREGRVG